MIKRALSYLSVVFAIFKRDLLRIVRNPVALILIVGACALPSAYAWYCTAANWDPYQNTEGIRIAVANEDEGAQTAETGSINIGQEVVDELKDNNELGWTFYDTADEALQSVYSGECYAALIIPRAFSSDFVSILSGNFTEPQIEYYLNEKISAAAPDFTNEGAQTIQDDIDEKFVDVVSQTVFSITQKYGRETETTAAEAESSLAQGVNLATQAIGETKSALSDTTPALDDMIDAAHEANDALADTESKLPALEEALDHVRSTLEEARTSTLDCLKKLQSALGSSLADIDSTSSEASTLLSQTSTELSQAQDTITTALAQLRTLVAQNDALISAIESIDDPDSDLTSSLADLRTSNEQLNALITALEDTNHTLDTSCEHTGNLASILSNNARTEAHDLASTSTKILSDFLPTITSSLDHYADAIGTLSGLTIALETSIEQTRSALQSLTDSLEQSRTLASDAEASLSAIQSRLESTQTDLESLTSSATVDKLKEFLKIDPTQAASFISAPVKLETNNVYPVKNYGSGVVVFFTSVALWIAGFVFIDLLKLRVREDGLPPFTQRQAYFGRWLLFMFLGIFPPLICCIGDLIIGIQCLNPAAFIFAGLVAGLVYVNLIYAFAQAFRYIGKGLVVLFLIIQIPGSSGLYPIEMMPAFYQALHPLLPFTYTIDAFREAIGGFYGMDYWIDLLILVLVFVPIGLFVGLVLGKWASNLTLLLDREIGRTGLFDGEQTPQEIKLRLSTLLRALLHSPEYRADLSQRVARFEARFPKLRAIGWFALVAQFLITFAIMILLQADVDTKLFLLMAMVAGIVVVDTYLIVIVYMKTSLSSQLSLAHLPKGELAEQTGKRVTMRSPQSLATESGKKDDRS